MCRAGVKYEFVFANTNTDTAYLYLYLNESRFAYLYFYFIPVFGVFGCVFAKYTKYGNQITTAGK